MDTSFRLSSNATSFGTIHGRRVSSQNLRMYLRKLSFVDGTP
jgi:hypothetical protein